MLTNKDHILGTRPNPTVKRRRKKKYWLFKLKYMCSYYNSYFGCFNNKLHYVLITIKYN